MNTDITNDNNSDMDTSIAPTADLADDTDAALDGGERELSDDELKLLFPKVELPPVQQLGEPADWAAIFGRSAPLVMEIGCGGGRTIITMAERDPSRNYLGVERAGEFYRILRDRVARRGLPQMRVSQMDAAYLLNRFVAPGSVNEYHIYFPDPWPKRRHLKRRLFTPEFCADVRRTLVPGGVLWFATDHHEYYTKILPRLREVLDVREHPEPWEDSPKGRTNFEVKYMRAGRPIYRLVCSKPAQT